MKRGLDYLAENAWVWAGTLLVLLTLSGSTLRAAMFIAGATIAVHAVATFLKGTDDSE